ncbi:MAG: peptide ABC transporter substrate-binding protein [marine bacterium B5-7]|nr:MAG: peptide ABC transporter substrate-binding protein [marine bacterium B5-7]
MVRAMANTLTEIDADGFVQPSLAESWEASSDAKTWSFELRKGVEFQNGKSFTAKDVVASINYHRGEKSESSVKPIVKPIKEIRTDGDYVVVFELEGGNADFPFILDTHGLVIFPAAADGSLDWRPGIGTGGYILEHYEPGVDAKLKRNPNYWKENRAHVDEVLLLTIKDSAARSNALITGGVDAIDQVDLKTAHLLARQSGFKVEETSGPLHYTFPMHTQTAPYNDNNVRLALKHAIDREEMLKKVLKGHGTIGNDHPIGPSYRYHAADIDQNVYDPDKARHFLKKSGLDSLTVKLSAADAAFEGAVDAAVLFSESAGKADIKIEVIREPDDGYWSNVWLKKPFCACYWAGYSTEDVMLSTGYASGAPWNDTQWNNPKFEELVAIARSELDESKRRELYRDIQIMLRDEGGAIVPIFANNVSARSEHIDHGKLSSTASFDGRRIVERWWMV